MTARERAAARRLDGPDCTAPLRTGLEVLPTSDALTRAAAELWAAAATV